MSGRCGPVTGCSPSSLHVGVGEAVLTVHCGAACSLGDWRVEEGCVYKLYQRKLSRGVLGWERLICFEGFFALVRAAVNRYILGRLPVRVI